ncbi:MAG: hypothetical protein KKG47_16845 [Proteobacteria bacterium]|nr:hypothetical protein [Pseudomonadota bacterium]MBU1736513.1 hypothetical protein [Pseudomonadota bacterium]
MKTFVAVAVAFLMTGVGASRAADTYRGTFYVAGMGGHFARAQIVIDPTTPEAPITLHALDKIDIGSRQTHPTHDPRIDNIDRNIMFWSTYQQDKSDEYANVAVTHVGKTDLRTGKVLVDKLVDIPSFADQKASLYCASAQSREHFIPIAMSNKGYIDIFNKSDLKMVRRITLEGTEADIGKPYRYYHGTNSPDYKRLLVTINESRSDHGETIGKIHLLELDLEKFTEGKIKVLNKKIATGNGPFVSFRQYYSPDGSMIANSAGNALLLIDAKTLEIIDHEPVGKLNDNHDAIFTPDGRYVIAAMRSKALLPNCEDPNNPKGNEFIMDGRLQLYDVKAKKFIGQAVSVCSTCHQKEQIDEHAVLCGLDAIFN